MNQAARPYIRFAAMIGVSMTVMYGLMYVNTYELSHIRWSETRFFMTLIMGGGMALVMLAFMREMYSVRLANIGVLVVSLALLLVAAALVRTQSTVDDRSYMKGMIPHHSIAILTSERARIRDVRVQQLAADILAAQRREIQEMDWLLEDISRHGPARTEEEARRRPVPEFAAGDGPAPAR